MGHPEGLRRPNEAGRHERRRAGGGRAIREKKAKKGV
jgi:hypothetical protein